MNNLRFSWSLRRRIFLAQLGAVAYVATMRTLITMGVVQLASKFNYAASLEKARMDAITTAVGNAGVLETRDGTQPAGPGTTATGTLLASHTMGSPFASGATTALPSVLSPTLPSNVNASASSTPTWFRIKTSGGTALIDGSAGASGCDMTIGATTSGQPVAVTAATFTSATYGH